MKKTVLLFIIIFITMTSFAQGYQIGDKAADFRLRNVDGKHYSMADFPDTKGFVVIFSCNHCPYVVAYEDRMIELHKKFAPIGFPVIAINPNDSVVQPQDSFINMQKRAKEKNFPFLYLHDAEQKVFPKFGATRTPHVFLLKREGNDLRVVYIGAIDDNHQDAAKVENKFLANAINAVMNGKEPDPNFTRAIGCSIKSRQK